ncbi:MAG: LuxR family transcriptional regulator [Chloroflexota bacterium]|nr:MAG: LuxR family transcriptional regulator [Chloroflexota bacterium]
MPAPILTTKLFIPPPRAQIVVRPRLRARLDETLHRKLTLVSAPAGFGKTTLVGEWCNQQRAPIAWLSLDESDSDPARFFAYLVAALQTLATSDGEKFSQVGDGVLALLQSPQPPSPDAILTVLLNELAIIPQNFVLALDDYHLIDAPPIDHALAFLLEHLPPQMHLVIGTRQDPQLPLAQLRARDQLTELRAADLRFTFSEASEFLNRVMGLHLSAQDIEQLETRTEGWIAGLQLAALAMSSNRTTRGESDTANFIQSFTGSHRFVLDYLLEQVLQQQPQEIQNFLLSTSILERLCGPLCDAVLRAPAGTGSATLANLERANLFIFPLDDERQWYRYHHLFAELLRQRLHTSSDASKEDATRRVNELHVRASDWFEAHELEIEAFQHATAANDIERAERLMQGRGIPLHLRGAVRMILDWLASLPKTAFDARPSLWWWYGAMLLVNGQPSGVEEKLDAAEAALHDAEMNEQTKRLIGRISVARATLALTRYDVETMLTQSRRALEYLEPNTLSLRANANWTLGFANLLLGNRAASRRAFTEAITLSQADEDIFTTILATTGLGNVQEFDNELYSAAETYQRIVEMGGDHPQQIISEAHRGLARIFYEWNDLEAAQRHGDKSLELARQYDRVIDRYIISQVFLARLKLAQGDVAGASAILTHADQDARAKNFVLRMPEIAAARVPVLLAQNNIAAAAQLAQQFDLPICQARVHLANGDAKAALAGLEPFRQFVESKKWADEQLKVMVLQAVAFAANKQRESSLELLSSALALAEPGGFIRLFVDEGEPMRLLILEFRFAILKTVPHLGAYLEKLLAAFPSPHTKSEITNPKSEIIESLSARELEILQLIAQGYSNQEICERLFLALSTVKGHNRIIFDKLHVKSRTEAVARARALGLIE